MSEKESNFLKEAISISEHKYMHKKNSEKKKKKKLNSMK